jgi:hypothetical protein
MDALARVLKPTGGPMELDTKDTAQKTEAEKEQEAKEYDARVEAMNVPTPDELATRVSGCKIWVMHGVLAKWNRGRLRLSGTRDHPANDRLQL